MSKSGETCFQAEASPWRGTKELIQNSMNMQHISDSVLYGFKKFINMLRGKQADNLGSYGWSPHDDKNPIKIERRSGTQNESPESPAPTTRKPFSPGK